MDERQHTPWKVSAIDPAHVDTGVGQMCIDCSKSGRTKKQDAQHAHRIVSCVNACEGLADPQATITALREASERALTIFRVVRDSEPDAWLRVLQQSDAADVWDALRAAVALVPPAAGKVE